jgi:Ca2+-binding RTX toxin-like protein
MSGNVTLQDLVYFGACWQLLNGQPDQTAPIVLDGGYRNAVVTRSADGNFFAGVVELAHGSNGAVTDVVLAFAGAAGADDFVQGESILAGLPVPQAEAAAAMFDQLMADPRYAGATIHVTGHSLGAGLTQYVLGHALATYGEAVTTARADFVQFGTPPWGQSIAAHFNLPLSAFDGHITGYVAQNDLVLDLLVDQSGIQMGTINYLAPVHALAVGVDNVSAHWPTTYIQALGLPSWLSDAQQAAVAAEIAGQSNTPLQADYGPVGGVSMTMVGDGAANDLQGSSADDVLIGGGGQDLLHGGAGADLFVFETVDASGIAAPDLIDDFSQVQGDRIDLRGISQALGAPWYEHIQFIGSAPFTAPGQVRTWNDGHDTFVAGSFGNGTAATFKIELTGVHYLTASDFLLNDGLSQPHYTKGFVPY